MSAYNSRIALQCFEEGQIHYQNQDFMKAVMAFQIALCYMPGYPDALFGLGITYAALGNHEEALECFLGVIENAWEYEDAHAFAGHSALELGYLGVAEERFRSALAQKPADHFAMFGLARVLYLRDDNREAANLLERAIVLSDDGAYYNLLGMVYCNSGSTFETLWYFREALRLCPEDAELVYKNIAMSLGTTRN